MDMDPIYREKVIKSEEHFPKWAKRSTESVGRKYHMDEDPFRTPFERDCHRVLHSLPFRRLKHKTQVFFAPRDDHICTRIEHSLHVASISSTICKRLDLNVTLAEAIALAHDLGHPPFGHLGEKALNNVHSAFNRKNKTNILSPFMHEAQSLRVIDCFRNSLHEPLNLTFEVRDGVVCHWGEKKDEQILKPSYSKDIKSVDASAARKQRPATIEGCVTRMADTISYLGRDFEDACMAKLVTPDGLPEDIKTVLGTTNSQIIGSLINDLVANSKGKNYLQFSDRVFIAMMKMREFNNQRIYGSAVLVGQEGRIFLILNELFNYFLSIITADSHEPEKIKNSDYNYYCRVFANFLNDMQYPEGTIKAQIASDFIAGMTDNFAMSCFESLFHVHPVI